MVQRCFPACISPRPLSTQTRPWASRGPSQGSSPGLLPGHMVTRSSAPATSGTTRQLARGATCWAPWLSKVCSLCLLGSVTSCSLSRPCSLHLWQLPHHHHPSCFLWARAGPGPQSGGLWFQGPNSPFGALLPSGLCPSQNLPGSPRPHPGPTPLRLMILFKMGFPIRRGNSCMCISTARKIKQVCL